MGRVIGNGGRDGRTIWPVTSTPSSTLGVDGDFSIDTTNKMIYGPKAAGAWPSGVSLAGANGLSAEYSNSAPLSLGAGANSGTANSAARYDHVHKFPLAVIGRTLTGANTLTANDLGAVVEWNSANANLTLPNNMEVGYNCIVRVIHASGIPTFVADTGATIRQADGYTKPRKQWSEVSVAVRSNANGTAAEYVLSGDLQ